MSFNYKSSRNGAERNLEPILLGNSLTVAVGEIVEGYTNGVAANGVASLPIKGFVHSIVKSENGLLPENKAGNTAGVVNTSDTQSVTTESDNTTTKSYWALIDTSKDSLYSGQVSGTLGTTANSDLPYGYIDVDSANTNYDRVLETTFTRTIGVAPKLNLYSHGLDPEDSTRLILSINNSEENPQPTA